MTWQTTSIYPSQAATFSNPNRPIVPIVPTFHFHHACHYPVWKRFRWIVPAVFGRCQPITGRIDEARPCTSSYACPNDHAGDAMELDFLINLQVCLPMLLPKRDGMTYVCFNCLRSQAAFSNRFVDLSSLQLYLPWRTLACLSIRFPIYSPTIDLLLRIPFQDFNLKILPEQHYRGSEDSKDGTWSRPRNIDQEPALSAQWPEVLCTRFEEMFVQIFPSAMGAASLTISKGTLAQLSRDHMLWSPRSNRAAHKPFLESSAGKSVAKRMSRVTLWRRKMPPAARLVKYPYVPCWCTNDMRSC